MAQRRMFNKTVTNNDNFLEMPDSSQNLYFHLSINADDDGFIDNWKSIIRMTGHKKEDLKLLIENEYVIPFDTGVIAITHWRLNNYLRKDRINPTVYQNELQRLEINNEGVYKLSTKLSTNGIHSIDQDSIEKNNIISVEKEYQKMVNLIDKTKEVIDYMNELAGTSYKSTTKKTQSMINARLKEGFTVEDLKDVVYYKYQEWCVKPFKFKNGQSSDYYFRPNTLFSTNFESYLEDYKKKT